MVVESPTHRSFGAQAFHYFTREHTEIPSAPIDAPAAWHGRDMLALEADWRIPFTAEEIAELDAALDRLEEEGQTLAGVDRRSASLPGLAERIDRWRTQLSTGRGFLVLSGLPVQRWGVPRSEMAFWLLGHWTSSPAASDRTGS